MSRQENKNGLCRSVKQIDILRRLWRAARKTKLSEPLYINALILADIRSMAALVLKDEEACSQTISFKERADKSKTDRRIGNAYPLDL